jgi:hypothetical protein
VHFPGAGWPDRYGFTEKQRRDGVDAEVDIANVTPIVDGVIDSLCACRPAHLAALISVREYFSHPDLRRRPLWHVRFFRIRTTVALALTD